jgi:hypothetical protein
MSNKIILSELDKCLFPEKYPFFNQYFQSEIEHLKKQEEYDKISMQNIAFKIKVVNYCCTVRDNNLRYLLNNLLNRYIENYLDWHREYDWYELKSILMFFLVFSRLRDEKELLSLFKELSLTILFAKYIPKISH